jgi:UDP-N-acetyl-D-mannosaminuronic acid dehydrogenase
MFKAFLTHNQFYSYLANLMEADMIRFQKVQGLYRTSEIGLEYLGTQAICSTNKSSSNKVLVIGLGQLGLPVAKYVKDRGGFDTYGYDISTKAMDRAQKIAGIKRIGDNSTGNDGISNNNNNNNNNNNAAYDFSEFDVFIICVSTHKPDDMFSPQIDGLLSIVEKISKEAKNGALVSIESTIPKGTSKKVFEMLNHRLHVAHAPHRWYALEQEEHGVNQLRVLGGVCQCCLDVAMQFYDGRVLVNGEEGEGQAYATEIESGKIDNLDNDNNDNENNYTNDKGNIIIDEQQHDTVNPHKSLGIRMHPVPQIEIAEITKIAENAHRYLQIAFAEDLYLYCQANNINFAELRDAVNTKWNVNILEPREGIGGHCLPKDTKMFLQSSKSIRSKILASAIEVDEDYRRYRQTRSIFVNTDSQRSYKEAKSDGYKVI